MNVFSLIPQSVSTVEYALHGFILFVLIIL
jgi:hypothetical protein